MGFCGLCLEMVCGVVAAPVPSCAEACMTEVRCLTVPQPQRIGERRHAHHPGPASVPTYPGPP
jgi:hypothetical protein